MGGDAKPLKALRGKEIETFRWRVNEGFGRHAPNEAGSLWEQESVGQEGVLIKVAGTVYLDPCECLLETFEDAISFLRLNE